MRFEEHIRRHQAAGILRDWGTARQRSGRVRTRFDDLMDLVTTQKLDWIVIATFDRFGIQDQREIFSFTLKLREYGVRLFSVEDNLDLTSADTGSFFQVAAKAVGSVGYTQQQAEKNIMKMIHMAEGGWATSGNVPYGLDLVLYDLHDTTRPHLRVIRTAQKPKRFRIVRYSDSSRVERDDLGVIIRSSLETVGKEETELMPARNKKTTGYRAEPSVCGDRIEAIRLMFELADRGFGFGAIADAMFEQGHRHFAKRFGAHAIEMALKNPAYIGMPAWGKTGVGKYRRNYGKQPRPVGREASGPITQKKTEADWVYPRTPVFKPIIDPELFERVNAKLKARRAENPACGKVRTRNRVSARSPAGSTRLNSPR
jgi:hypothetical protein